MTRCSEQVCRPLATSTRTAAATRTRYVSAIARALDIMYECLQFGDDFETYNFAWVNDLCTAYVCEPVPRPSPGTDTFCLCSDSDGDGFSNGMELGVSSLCVSCAIINALTIVCNCRTRVGTRALRKSRHLANLMSV
jgi:hypothetical protein